MESGTRLGPYEIQEQLGAGGMGEVYRARDTALDRDVAIKVLPEDLVADPSRLARFEREAKLLASLSHPNIATIHGFDESGGVRFIAMELVEGVSLAERLKQGALSTAEALVVCTQIAKALDAAHLAGVVHRDLKPANVLLATDGDVRLVDFGIAREAPASRAEVTSVPTTDGELTHAGELVGTIPYMSPEQLRGEEVDARSDVWALGCTLYECLVGASPFVRTTAPETTAAILREEPDWSRLPTGLPSADLRLLTRMLEKDPRERLRSAGDAGFEMRASLDDSPTVVDSSTRTQPASNVLWMVACAFLIGVAALGWMGRPDTTGASGGLGRRLAIALPNGVELSEQNTRAVAISPGGDYWAFSAREGGSGPSQIYLQRFDEPTARAVADSDEASNPVFSPDGEWLAYFNEGGWLHKVPVSGGRSTELCTDCDPRGAAWGSDGFIYYGTAQSGLRRVSSSGGAPEVVTTIEPAGGANAHMFPSFVPGTEAIVFSVLGGGEGPGQRRLDLLDLSDQTRKVLIPNGVDGRVVASGHLVYGVEPNLLAVPFDFATMSVSGDPGPLPEVPLVRWSFRAAGTWSASSNGELLYWPSRPEPKVEIARLLPDGTVNGLGAPISNYRSVAISPDGRRLAVNVRGVGWRAGVYDIARGTTTLVSERAVSARPPVWSSNGDLLYSLQGERGDDLYVQPAGAGSPAALLHEGGGALWATTGRSNGNVVYSEQSPATHMDIWELDPSTGERQPLVKTAEPDLGAALSPDERWLALFTQVSGRLQLFVQRHPGGEDRAQISTTNTSWAGWSPSGRALYFHEGGQIMKVEVDEDSETPFGRSQALFRVDYHSAHAGHGITVVGEDEFIFLRLAGPPTPADRLILVTDWFDELERLVPTDR